MRNISVIIILIATIIFINYNFLFNDQKVREVVTIGNIEYSNQKILYDKLNQLIGQEIYKINLRNLKKNLENDSWIKYAQISIQKPDILDIEIIEFQPVYIWNNDVYIDQEGEIIISKKMPIQDILKLSSNISDHKETYQIFIKIQTILSLINLNVLQVERDLDLLKIHTNKYNFLVSFGIFERKLKEFVTIYDQFSSKSKNLRDIKNIDLRYPTGFAVE